MKSAARWFCFFGVLCLAPATAFGANLFQEDFEDTNFTARGWYDSTGGALSTAEFFAGARSFECRFAPGATGCAGGSPARHLFTPSDAVYVSYYVKYSANYTGSNRQYHPHEFLILTNENGAYAGPAYTRLTAYIEQNEGIPLLALQDGQNIDVSRLNQDLTGVTEQRSTCGCNGVPAAEAASTVSCYPVSTMYWNGKDWRAGGTPNSHAGTVYFGDTPGPRYKNDWHRVEAYFRLNSIQNGQGAPDGVIRYWFDGALIIERTNVILRTAQHPNMQWNQFMIAPWIGDGSPVDQTMWVDNLSVETTRPGADTIPPAAPTNLTVQ